MIRRFAANRGQLRPLVSVPFSGRSITDSAPTALPGQMPTTYVPSNTARRVESPGQRLCRNPIAAGVVSGRMRRNTSRIAPASCLAAPIHRACLRYGRR
jgi:hypothetical protein